MNMRAMMLVAAAAIGVFLLGCAQGRAVSAGPGLRLAELTVGAEVSRYALYTPRTEFAGKGPLPLIVFLHGSGESGTDGSKACTVGLLPAVLSEPARWPAFVLVLQKPTVAARWVDQAAAIDAVLEKTLAELGSRVDRDRLYLTGLSQGGAGTWQVAALEPARWAAIVPICGFIHLPVGGPGRFGGAAADAEAVDRLARSGVPIWAFHGGRDDVVPPACTTSMVDAIRAARGADDERVKFTLFPEANHNAWDPAYRGPELPAWLFAQQRGRR